MWQGRKDTKPMIATILVALDGSTLAEQALDQARRLARQTRAAMLLLRIAPFTTVSETLSETPVSLASGTAREARRYLAGLREHLARDGISSRTIVVPGDAARGIVSVAQTYGADLIAMGTHGRSGLRQALLGSVAQAVLHHTTIPVFLVRGADQPGMNRTDHVHTILVPLDGTPFAEAAFSYVTQMHLDWDTRLVLLRAVSPAEAQWEGEVQPSAALAYLDSLVTTRLPGRTYQTLVRVDEPAKAILETAALEQVDLVVMATHGRAGLDGLIHGSVARHLLQHSPVPLLLVHQPADAATSSGLSATDTIEIPQETPPTMALPERQRANHR
jgi:nucleotide-binding universal stress UspA family protein